MSVPLFQEIHIENTNSCGYKCVMCPRESQTRRIGFMSLEDFSFLLERIGPSQRTFHLHGFGEPLLDRQLVPKIKELKKKSPSSFGLIFSTLGVRVPEDYFVKLLEAGLDAIVISLYGFNSEDYKKVHGYDGFELVKKNLQLLSDAMVPFQKFKATLKSPSIAISSPLPILGSSERKSFCEWAEKLGFDLGQWRDLHNYGNGRNYNTPKPKKICPVINGKRRNILNITWSLDVIPCCYDFNASIPFGNLRKQSLEEIFSSPEYLAFVLAHQTGNIAAYSACQNCEKNDYA